MTTTRPTRPSLRVSIPIVLALALAPSVACGDDPAASDQDVSAPADTQTGPDAADTAGAPDADAGPDAPRRAPPVLVWEPCELLDAPSDATTCATTLAPLTLGDPAGRTVELFVKRVLADPAIVPPGAPRRALWLLLGGPGQAGADGEGIAAMLQARDPGLDVYLPDHRGTGFSFRLGCPVQEGARSPNGAGIDLSEWPGCRAAVVAKWGDQLAHFSTTEAALDVESLVRATHSEADEVFLLGISYGTYLVSRYLQLFPDGAGVDAVVLDSICPSVGCALSDIDVWEDTVAHAILDTCPDDVDCARFYPEGQPGPWDELGRLYDRIAKGHCPLTDDPALDGDLLRVHLGQLMFSYAGRRLVPALIRRYHRCAPTDVAAIRRSFVANLGFDPGTLGSAAPLWPTPVPPAALDPRTFSMALAVNITRSELWADPAPSVDELATRHAATRACRGAALSIGTGGEHWPIYDEPLAGAWPEFRIPVLAMNADYDTATPAAYARTIASHLTGPNQAYFEIPGHGHTVIAQGQLIDDPTTTCGRELLLQFLADPRAEVDDACLTQSLPLQFKLREQAVEHWFGTTDLWGDDELAPE